MLPGGCSLRLLRSVIQNKNVYRLNFMSSFTSFLIALSLGLSIFGSGPLHWLVTNQSVSVCTCVCVRACMCRLVRGWCGQKQTSGTEVKGDLVSLAGWGSSLQLHTDGRGAVWLLVSGVIYLVSCASLWPINDQQKWRMSHLISWLCRNLQLTVVVLWTFV